MKSAKFLLIGALITAACSSVGEFPPEPDANPARATLYVTNKFGNSLSVVDLQTGKEMRRIDTCTNPHELAVSPDGAHLAVACYGGTTVDIFATARLARVVSLDLGENARPHGIVWHSAGALFVTAEGRQSIFRITGALSDTPELSEFKTNQRGSHMLAVAPDARTVWTTDLGSKTVSRVNLDDASDLRSVTVGEEPEGIALTPDGQELWVSTRGSDEVFILDPQTLEVRKKLGAGSFPLRLAIRPDGKYAVTSDLGNGGMTVYDTARQEPTRYILVGGPDEAEKRQQVTILWSDDGERIYLAETGSDTVAEVDFASGEVLRRIAVGDGGDGLAILQPVGAP